MSFVVSATSPREDALATAERVVDEHFEQLCAIRWSDKRVALYMGGKLTATDAAAVLMLVAGLPGRRGAEIEEMRGALARDADLHLVVVAPGFFGGRPAMTFTASALSFGDELDGAHRGAGGDA